MIGGTVDDEGWETVAGVADRLVEGVAESNILSHNYLFSLLSSAGFALGPGLIGEAKRVPNDVERQRNNVRTDGRSGDCVLPAFLAHIPVVPYACALISCTFISTLRIQMQRS